MSPQRSTCPPEASAPPCSAPNPPYARSSSGTQPAPTRIEQDIRFEQVSFTYPARDTPVYADLDLTIAAGQSLAIVGLNGAGKTTLAKLLTGLETPQTGRISIDGVDLRQIDPVSWHRNVAAIFQDFVHYQLPATDNIGFGAIGELHQPDARQQARRAAERAGAEQIIAGLPDGSTRHCRLLSPAVWICPVDSGSGSRWPGRCGRSRPARRC